MPALLSSNLKEDRIIQGAICYCHVAYRREYLPKKLWLNAFFSEMAAIIGINDGKTDIQTEPACRG